MKFKKIKGPNNFVDQNEFAGKPDGIYEHTNNSGGVNLIYWRSGMMFWLHEVDRPEPFVHELEKLFEAEIQESKKPEPEKEVISVNTHLKALAILKGYVNNLELN